MNPRTAVALIAVLIGCMTGALMVAATGRVVQALIVLCGTLLGGLLSALVFSMIKGVTKDDE